MKCDVGWFFHKKKNNNEHSKMLNDKLAELHESVDVSDDTLKECENVKE